MLQNGFKAPKTTKTGMGIYKDGVILGADTRATSGPIVSDKNCEKIHLLSASKMDHPWIEYLNKPEHVIRVQEYFGIRYVQKSENDKHTSGDHRSKVEDDTSREGIAVTNKLWYYLFIIGTELGDEIFYACFIPFWFWNVDGFVGRRFVFVWMMLMYVGQALKDLWRSPRPPKPVVKLQSKWGAEYGLPSTHAMVGISIPFSILLYTHERYQYSFIAGLVICTLWCTLICVSRLYLGMHSVLDIVAGLALAIGLMFPMVPLVDRLDTWLLTTTYSPLLIVAVSLLLIKFYPQPDKWTPTRGDTTLCVGLYAGIEVGAWLNYQLGYMDVPDTPPPYPIMWPSYAMLGHLFIRSFIGIFAVLVTRSLGKSLCYSAICAFLGRDKTELMKSENSLANKQKIFVDLCSKFGMTVMIGMNIQFLLPNLFKMMSIGRIDFYTEI